MKTTFKACIGEQDADRRAVRLLALCLTAVLWLSFMQLLYAETAPEDGASSTILFVVETSAATAKADPEGLLSHAIKLSAALLGQEDGFGIVTFNAKEAKLLGKITQADQKATIYKTIDSIGKTANDNVTQVNPYSALSLALKELSQPAANRTVVLVSASAAYAPAHEDNKKVRTSIMSELVPAFKEKGIRLFTVPLGPESDKDFLEEISRSTGGFSYPTPKTASLNATAALIYETVKSPDILPSESGRFMIDESIEQMTLVLSKKPDFKLILQSPEGENYSADKNAAGINWTRFSNFDIIRIDAPDPGQWNFMSVDDKDNHIYISTHLKIRSNVRSSYQRIFTELPVDAWLTIDNLVVDLKDLSDAILISGSLAAPDVDIPPEKVEIKVRKKDKKDMEDKEKKKGKEHAKEKKKDDKKDDKEEVHESATSARGVLTGQVTPKTIGLNRLTIFVRSKAIERSKSFLIAVIEERESNKGNPLTVKTESDVLPQIPQGKQTKITAWLSNKYVSHTPSAINHALKWFIVINIVLFLSILLYSKRAVLLKTKSAGVRKPEMKKVTAKPEEAQTHDQD